MCALFGRELKGQPFGRLWPSFAAAEARDCIEIVTEDTAGLLSGYVAVTLEGAAINLEMILLPLRDHGRTHASVLGALSPATAPLWLGFSPVALSGAVSRRVIRTVWPAEPTGTAAKSQRRFVVHRGGRA